MNFRKAQTVPFFISIASNSIIISIFAPASRAGAFRLTHHQGEKLKNSDANPVDKVFGAKFGMEFGVKFGAKFGVNEKRVLVLLDENPPLSATEIAERIGISKRGVEKQLKKFKELGVISRQGSDKTGLWIINK